MHHRALTLALLLCLSNLTQAQQPAPPEPLTAVQRQEVIAGLATTNWERTGVKPDVAVPAADAQKTAHAAILKTLIVASKDADEKNELQDLLAKLEADKLDPPNYAPPR